MPDISAGAVPPSANVRILYVPPPPVLNPARGNIPADKVKQAFGMVNSKRYGVTLRVEGYKLTRYYATDRFGNYKSETTYHLPVVEVNGRQVEVNPIRATYNADVKCNAKCMASKGPNCECSCGGKNHGSSWTAAVGE